MTGKKTRQENLEVAECDRQLASLAAKQQETYLNIGRVYAGKNTAEAAKGTSYGEYMEERSGSHRIRSFTRKKAGSPGAAQM